MHIKKIGLLFSTSTAVLLASTIAALAVPAVATGAVNVRTGPNTSYNKVDALYSGESVNVTECNSGWCYVEHSGPNGWVSGNFLASPSTSSSGSSSSPSVNFGVTWSPGSGGPSFSITIGSGATSSPPPAPGYMAPQVCFYKGNNYSGSNFCVAPGSNENHLGSSWNNKISSIKVMGGASVQVCKNWNYFGSCRTYTTNKPHLNAGNYNNKISSYRTWM